MTCVFFQYSLPQSLTFKKNLYYCRLLLYLIYFRCVKKKSVKTLPSSTVYYSTAIDVISVYFPPAPTWFSLILWKKKIHNPAGQDWRKIPPSPPHLVANLCDVPYYAMIKNGYVLHPYPVMARYRKRNPKDRKSFGSSYFGLTRFYGHAHVGNSAVFLPQFISTETGTILLICFCYYYEFIITITLSIWSDKRCCKKVRWKNKKIRLAVFFLQSKLLFFLYKKTILHT